MVQLARLSGAAHVVLSEPVSMRRDAGLALGADIVVDPTQHDLVEAVRRVSGCSGADVVIECVGRPEAARSALEAAGFGATVLLFSVPAPDAAIPLPLFDVYKKELTVRGSFINPDTHQWAVDLLSARRVSTGPIVTDTFNLYQMEEAILMQMSSDSIKVMMLPNGEAGA